MEIQNSIWAYNYLIKYSLQLAFIGVRSELPLLSYKHINSFGGKVKTDSSRYV